MDRIDLDAIMAEMDNIPFGNSRFQAEHLVDGQEAPARQYRHVMLQLRQKIAALKATEHQGERTRIDIEELEHKLAGKIENDFDRRRMEVDLKEKRWQLREAETLVHDAMIEIQNYLRVKEKLPTPTREEFEAAELGYWRKRLMNDAKLEYQAAGRIETGTLKALAKVDIIARREKLNSGEEQIRFLDAKILALAGGNHK
jgi:hypothetical protein